MKIIKVNYLLLILVIISSSCSSVDEESDVNELEDSKPNGELEVILDSARKINTIIHHFENSQINN